MLRSLGFPELILIAVVLLLLFGGRWLARAGRAAGQSARRKALEANWIWTSTTGTEEEGRRAERTFGQELAQVVLNESDDPVAAAKVTAVDGMGAELCEVKKTAWPISYRVIPKQEFNAFALPGGFVFVCEPLFDVFREDSMQWPSYWLYETAHVLLGHPRERFVRELVLHGVAAGTARAGELIKTLIGQGFSRDEELEADREAVSLLIAAGFHKSGATRFFYLLGRLTQSEPELMQVFPSHPPIEDRLKNLEGQCSAT